MATSFGPGYQLGQPPQGTQVGTAENLFSHIADPELRKRNIQAWNAYNKGKNTPVPKRGPSQAEMRALRLLNAERQAAAPVPEGAMTSAEEQAMMKQAAAERDAAYGGLGRFNTGNARELARQAYNTGMGIPGGGMNAARGSVIAAGAGKKTVGRYAGSVKEGVKAAREDAVNLTAQATKETARRAAGKRPLGVRSTTGQFVPKAGQRMTEAIGREARWDKLGYAGKTLGSLGAVGLGLNLANNPQPQLEEFYNNLTTEQLEAVQTQLAQGPQAGVPPSGYSGSNIQDDPNFHVRGGFRDFGAPGTMEYSMAQAPTVAPPQASAPTRMRAPVPIQAAAVAAPDPAIAKAMQAKAMQEAYYNNKLNPFGAGSGYEELQGYRRY